MKPFHNLNADEIKKAVSWAAKNGLISKKEKPPHPHRPPRAPLMPSSVERQERHTWQSIANQTGFSMTYCRLVWIGERRNDALLARLNEIAGQSPMPASNSPALT